MLMDEQKNPSSYSIFVNGMDTHKIIAATSESHIANITFFTSDVYISVNGVPKTDAEVIFNNGIDKCNIYKSPDAHYIAHLLDREYDLDYYVSVTGTVDNKNSVNLYSKNLNLTYYTVDFMNYETNDEGKTYTLKEKPHRTQIVREGKPANSVVDPYLSGASFNYFANTT